MPDVRVRTILALGLVGAAAACVDLFHSTDFVTLCQQSPQDPACGGPAPDGGEDAAGSDGEDADVAEPGEDDFERDEPDERDEPGAG